MGPKGSKKGEEGFGKAAGGSSKRSEGKVAGGPPQPIFEVNAAVMASDTQFTSKGELYKARVVRAHLVDEADQKRRYLIHYTGWSRKYDIWVESNQLALEDDLEAVKRLGERQNQKKEAASAAKKDSEGGRETRSSEEEPPLKKQNTALSMQEKVDEDKVIKKNRILLANSDLQEETEESASALADMNIPMPIKRHLVDEWSLICEKDPKRLLKLPRQKHVTGIFADYLMYKTVKDKVTDKELETYKDFSESMALYFDRALSVTLLYRWERDQFDNAQKMIEEKELRPSLVYGGEHLCRMFVNMAKQIPSIVAGRQEMTQFKDNIADFLKFFSKPSSMAQYVIPEDYVLAEEAVCMQNEEGKMMEVEEQEGGKGEGSSSSSSKSPGKSHPTW